MSEFEIAAEVEATPGPADAEWLAKANAMLHERIAALEAENAALRGEEAEQCLSASRLKPHQPITRDGKTTCYRCGETLRGEEE